MIISVVAVVVGQGWSVDLIKRPHHQVICKVAAHPRQMLLDRDVELKRLKRPMAKRTRAPRVICAMHLGNIWFVPKLVKGFDLLS